MFVFQSFTTMFFLFKDVSCYFSCLKMIGPFPPPQKTNKQTTKKSQKGTGQIVLLCIGLKLCHRVSIEERKKNSIKQSFRNDSCHFLIKSCVCLTDNFPIICLYSPTITKSIHSCVLETPPGWLSGEHVGLMTWWLRVRSPVEATFLSGVFSPLTSA